MKKVLALTAAAACLTLSNAATAGYSTCGGQQVPPGTRRCPDGSLPMYHASAVASPSIWGEIPRRGTTVQSPQPVQAQAQQPAASAADPSALFGVWHTGVSGGVWQTPSAVPGYDLLHISPGVRSGDLTIDSSGRYVWNSYGGKTGRWERGDAQYPIVLVDTVENKRWRVGPDVRHPGNIFIWDGNFTYNGKR